MRRIFILYSKNKFAMTDFDNTNYAGIAELVDANPDMGWKQNFGNKVWMSGIVSELAGSDVQYDFGYEDIEISYINKNYDCVILPLANCFHKGWVSYLHKRAEFVKQIEIPVYVIACGIQCTSRDEISKLIEDIEKPARTFIEAVYQTGGEFALRGNITKEFFDKLGYKSAVVTGCPSMFQMGRNLEITNSKVSRQEFKAVLNGDYKLPISKKEYRNCDFIDQGVYTELLYNPNYASLHTLEFRKVAKEVARYGLSVVQSVAEQRTKLFMNLQQWMKYFEEENVHFSFGSRIHGTIMPILSGVPAMIVPCDARTYEMAEFFDIPMLENLGGGQKEYDLYDLYCETDYTKFNENFARRFDAFESFLREHNIVDDINQHNIFMVKNAENVQMPPQMNEAYFKSYSAYLKKNWLALKLIDILYR